MRVTSQHQINREEYRHYSDKDNGIDIDDIIRRQMINEIAKTIVDENLVEIKKNDDEYDPHAILFSAEYHVISKENWTKLINMLRPMSFVSATNTETQNRVNLFTLLKSI